MRVTKSLCLFSRNDPVFSISAPGDFHYQALRFSSVFHFVAYSQATFFREDDIAQKILATSSIQVCKELLEDLKEYDQSRWEEEREKYVYIGFREKFIQNHALLGELLATGDRLIAMASSRDSFWGIGLAEDDETANVISLWIGQNRLGHILTTIRDKFLEGYEDGTLPRRARWAIDELIRNPDLMKKAS